MPFFPGDNIAADLRRFLVVLDFTRRVEIQGEKVDSRTTFLQLPAVHTEFRQDFLRDVVVFRHVFGLTVAYWNNCSNLGPNLSRNRLFRRCFLAFAPLSSIPNSSANSWFCLPSTVWSSTTRSFGPSSS